MTRKTLTMVDKLVMFIGGGLVVLGVAVLGFINDFLMDAPTMVVEEEGQIVAEPVIDPHIRGVIAMLGLLVFLLYGFYKLAGTRGADSEETVTTAERAG